MIQKTRYSTALALLVAGSVGASSCGKRSDRDDGPAFVEDAAVPPPLTVRYHGCAAVVREAEGLFCETEPAAALHLWIESAPSAELWLDGEPLGLPEPATGGLRVTRDVADLGEAAVIRATRDGSHREWRLALRPYLPPEWLVRARQLRKHGEHELARAVLEEWLSRPLPLALRARATGLLARAVLSSGDAKEAVMLLREAVPMDLEAGLVKAASDDSVAMAFYLIRNLGRFDEAAQVLKDEDGVITAYPGGWARLPYYRGLLARDTSSTREAIQRFEEAMRRSERIGLTANYTAAGHQLGEVYAGMGRTHDVIAVYDRMRRAIPPDADSCVWAGHHHNFAAAVLEAMDEETDGLDIAGASALGVVASDPAEALKRALSWYEDGCMERPISYVSALANRGRAALLAGQFDAAAEWMDRARSRRAATMDDDDRNRPDWRTLDWAVVDARVAFARRDTEAALVAFDELDLRASRSLSAKHVWLAAVGRARVHESVGRLREARESYAEAEIRLDRYTLLVPLGEGRSSSLALRRHATQAYVDLLIRLGDAETALQVSRNARARLLAGVRSPARIAELPPQDRENLSARLARYRDARRDLENAAELLWVTPARERRRAEADYEAARKHASRQLEAALASATAAGALGAELPPPGDNEVSLYYFSGAGGWYGFVADADSVRVVELGRVDLEHSTPAALTMALLSPFEDEIRRARRLRLVPSGPLRGLDFHALPWGKGQLIDETTVVYGLDVAPATEKRGWEGRAAVIADPEGNLGQARVGRRLATRGLQDAGWAVEERVGGTTIGAATPSTDEVRPASGSGVRELLETVSFVHYAGHGRVKGLDGWASGLPLADGGELTVGDILALASVPRWLVLSGCETGRSISEAAEEGLAVAQAFLVRGSRVVIATSRLIPDDSGLANALYGEHRTWDGLGPNLADAVRAALVRMRDARNGNWSSWRIMVP